MEKDDEFSWDLDDEQTREEFVRPPKDLAVSTNIKPQNEKEDSDEWEWEEANKSDDSQSDGNKEKESKAVIQTEIDSRKSVKVDNNLTVLVETLKKQLQESKQQLLEAQSALEAERSVRLEQEKMILTQKNEFEKHQHEWEKERNDLLNRVAHAELLHDQVRDHSELQVSLEYEKVKQQYLCLVEQLEEVKSDRDIKNESLLVLESKLQVLQGEHDNLVGKLKDSYQEDTQVVQTLQELSQVKDELAIARQKEEEISAVLDQTRAELSSVLNQNSQLEEQLVQMKDAAILTKENQQAKECKEHSKQSFGLNNTDLELNRELESKHVQENSEKKDTCLKATEHAMQPISQV